MRMHMIASVAALAIAALVSPASAVDLQNAKLSNITIGAGSGGLGQSGLNNSASISGSRITATNSVRTTFGNGVNQNPDGNNGIGGVGTGVAQTTRLEAGGNVVNSTSLTGSGTIQGSYATQTQGGALNPQQGSLDSQALSASGRLDGSFQRTASSNAGTGLSGYSGVQLNGPGSISNTVNGSALAIGAGISGAAGLSTTR